MSKVYPAISVIIPVYNAETYIERCVTSICNNTFRDYEILCIDDGSTDSSATILERLASKDDRIRIITQENQGVSAARNLGIEKAQGEYIAFIDNDDYVHRQYLEVLYDSIKEVQADLAICDFASPDVYEKNNLCVPLGVFEKCEISGEQLMRSEAYGRYRRTIWARLISRSAIREGFPEGVQGSEDCLFNILNIRNSTRVVLTQVPLYFHFQHATSAFHCINYERASQGIEWSINYVKDTEKPFRAEVLAYAYKMIFLYRYICTLGGGHEKREINHQSKRYLKRCSKYKSLLTLIERMTFFLMGLFPLLYRSYRIIQDPTMKAWEKQMRTAKEKVHGSEVNRRGALL